MEKLNIFNKVPDNFYSILASKNRYLYTEIMYIIYRLFDDEISFGLVREEVVEMVVDFIADNHVDGEDEYKGLSIRDYANAVIRRLVEYGWLDIERNYNHDEFIIITELARLQMETLINFKSDDSYEYQSQIIIMYRLLLNKSDLEPNILIKRLYADMRSLINSLKSLNSNIKNYIGSATKKTEANDLIAQLFGEYKIEIIDKAYHRLKTSENVSKYRPVIVEELELMYLDRNFVRTAAQLEVKDNGGDEDNHFYNFFEKINSCIRHINELDDLIGEIDYRNSQYLKAASNRVKFLMNSQENIEGHINSLLKHLVERLDEYDGFDTLDDLDLMFNLYSQSYIDENSLMKKRSTSKTFKSQQLVDQLMSKEERKVLFDENRKSRNKRLTRAKINQYVINLMEESTKLDSSRVPLNNMDDFIKLVYIKLYGRHALSDYQLINKKDYIKVNDYEFIDFEIRRKL
jgi:hypothetical protein